MIALVYDVSRPETFIKCKQTLAKVRHIICPSKLTPGVCLCVCVCVCVCTMSILVYCDKNSTNHLFIFYLAGVLIANKIDRYSTNLDCVEMRDGAKFSERYALRFFETSAVRLSSKPASACAQQKITNMSYKDCPHSCTYSVFFSL